MSKVNTVICPPGTNMSNISNAINQFVVDASIANPDYQLIGTPQIYSEINTMSISGDILTVLSRSYWVVITSEPKLEFKTG